MRAIPKSVKCPKCHKKFNAIIGDVLPFDLKFQVKGLQLLFLFINHNS